MNYYLFHENHNIVLRSKKITKRESFFYTNDSQVENKIDSAHKNPWNFDNLNHILQTSNNVFKLENSVDENAKYKTELEYHSNFGLFMVHANRTYKPGLYFAMQNHKKDLLSKLNFGLTWTDVYNHNSTITYLKLDDNPKFKNFLAEEAEKFNFINPNEKLDLSQISKIDNIALGVITSFFWKIPDSKHKIGAYFKIEQSIKSSKNQKLAFALSWSKLKSFDLFVKIKALGFSIDSLNEKVIQEIKRRVKIVVN